jgi:ATP-dependent Clp protease adaptor protein ClpS
MGMAKKDRIGPAGGPEREEQAGVATQDEKKPQKPRLYKVLLLNDDYTTMEFVVKVLMSVFHLEEEKAVEIMLHVHHNGVGVAGVFTYEVAETKANKVHELARQEEFPLRCALEPA